MAATLRFIAALPLAAAMLLTPAPIIPAQAQQARPSLDEVSRRLLADVQRAGEDLAGEALAQWIVASRDDAVKAGVRPMPDAVRARLRGHLPEALLARVRYRVGTGHELSLQTNAFKGNAAAITLGDVILFRAEEQAGADVRLWAHELAHVRQYDRWGVRGFARRYTRDHLAVEAEANAEAAKVTAAMAAARGR